MHFLVWGLFILYEPVAIGLAVGEFGHILSYVINYGLNIGFFYLHDLLVMPVLHRSTGFGYFAFILLIVSEFIVYALVSHSINYGFLSPRAIVDVAYKAFDLPFFMGRSWRLSYFLGFATGHFYLKKYLQEHQGNLLLEREAMNNAIREGEMKVALAEAKSAALRAQINPHFLFNVLNFMYGIALKTNPSLGKVTMLLSKVMRYALATEHGTEEVLLKKEIDHVSNMINLWKTIKNDQFYVEFSYDPEAEQIRIIPLILLTLCENMFKYGNLRNPDEPAYFFLRIEAGRLVIETDNLVQEFDASRSEKSTGTGLENIRQRLTLAYGKRVAFQYGRDPDKRFKVRIELWGLFEVSSAFVRKKGTLAEQGPNEV